MVPPDRTQEDEIMAFGVEVILYRENKTCEENSDEIVFEAEDVERHKTKKFSRGRGGTHFARRKLEQHVFFGQAQHRVVFGESHILWRKLQRHRFWGTRSVEDGRVLVGGRQQSRADLVLCGRTENCSDGKGACPGRHSPVHDWRITSGANVWVAAATTWGFNRWAVLPGGRSGGGGV